MTELRRIMAIIAYWWRKDRIRAAPGEGRVLRMRPGNYVRIDERLYEIVSSQARRCEAGPYVDYRCRPAHADGDSGIDADFLLTAGPVRADRACRIEFSDGAMRRELTADDIHVYDRLENGLRSSFSF